MNDKNIYNKRPAIVKYIGRTENEEFSYGKEYYTYIEYWQGKRNSLHVKGNSGKITYFNPFEDFEVILDEDNVLNTNEAIVECLTHNFDKEVFGVKCGKQYKTLGRDKDGLYLIMDETYDRYFYSPEYFKIIEDKHGLLSRCSVYYNLNKS